MVNEKEKLYIKTKLIQTIDESKNVMSNDIQCILE